MSRAAVKMVESTCVAIGMLAGLGAATSAVGATSTAVRAGCASSNCLRPEQILNWYDAWRMKRDMQRGALLLDIRSAVRTGSGSLIPQFDRRVPFVEHDGGAAGPGTMRFHADFTTRVDEALRAQGLRTSDPVLLQCETPYCGELAALLLQEYGYTRVFVVADGTNPSRRLAR